MKGLDIMQANVRLKNGEVKHLRIVGLENDGSGEYGYAVMGIWYIPVSQSTTITHADGHVEKAWDEIVGSDWMDAEDYRKYHTYQSRW
jgi:hypothetical protein